MRQNLHVLARIIERFNRGIYVVDVRSDFFLRFFVDRDELLELYFILTRVKGLMVEE